MVTTIPYCGVEELFMELPRRLWQNHQVKNAMKESALILAVGFLGSYQSASAHPRMVKAASAPYTPSQYPILSFG